MVNDPGTNLKSISSETESKISREVPVNVGAEQALLGAIISNNLALEIVEDSENYEER